MISFSIFYSKCGMLCSDDLYRLKNSSFIIFMIYKATIILHFKKYFFHCKRCLYSYTMSEKSKLPPNFDDTVFKKKETLKSHFIFITICEEDYAFSDIYFKREFFTRNDFYFNVIFGQTFLGRIGEKKSLNYFPSVEHDIL